MKKLFLVVVLAGLLLPLVSFAGTYKAINKDGAEINVCYEGLVPCGLEKPMWVDGEWKDGECKGTLDTKGVSCQFCHFFVLLKEIINFVLKLVIAVSVLMLTIGGFLFFLGGGDPGQTQKAKEIMKAALIGLAIMFASWVIINTIFMFMGVQGWTGLQEGWFKIDCPIQL